MEGEDAKNYLFFVGRNRFKEYFLKPFESMIDNDDDDFDSFNIMEAGAIFTLSMNRNYNVKYASILSVSSDNTDINLTLSRLDAYLNPIAITIKYPTFAENFILRRENDRISNKFWGNNMNSITLPDKINIVCYFVIMPALKDFINPEYLESICDKYKRSASNFPIQPFNGIFVSDIKEYQTIAGCYLTGKNITCNIYVLPCLHEIYEGARDGIRKIIKKNETNEQNMLYNERNTNCRKDEEDLNTSTLSFFSKNRKDMNVCDKINNTKVNWEVYLDFYNGYRDQNNSGRKLCRENNFLRIFLKYLDNNSNFVVPVVNRIVDVGGKKYRKSRKLKRSRKHKSRKYKNKSRK
jgi:hypothetical protein